MPLNTQFAGMPWLTQPADPIDSLAKGASAGAQIAGTMARRQALKLQAQGMEQDERFREIDSDLRRRQVESMMDVREAQAGAARAKLEQLGAYAASEKQGWDNVNSTMEKADEINKDDPEWLSVKRPQFFQDVLWNNRHLTYASRPEIPQRMEAAKMLNETRRGAIASREQMAADKLDFQEKALTNKDTRTTTQKDTDALVAAENAALMTGNKPPRNPAEEAARRVELLTPKVIGSGRDKESVNESDIKFLRTLTDPAEIELLTTKMLGRAGQPKNEAQALKKFAAQEKLRSLKTQVFKKDEYDAAVKKILSEYEASLGVAPTEKQTAPGQSFQSFEQWRQQRKAQNAK